MDPFEISSRRRGYKALTIILVLLFAFIFALTFDINGLDNFLRQFEPLGYILSLFA